MSCTNSAVTFESAMDPSETLDYVASFSTLLETGELITSFSVELSQDAQDAGVIILNTPPPVLEADSQGILFWLEVLLAEQENEIFCGLGFKASLTFTIETSTTPRTYQRTFIVPIKQL